MKSATIITFSTRANFGIFSQNYVSEVATLAIHCGQEAHLVYDNPNAIILTYEASFRVV